MNLRGKTAVVTGASSGIGRAVALELAGAGCNLALAARRSEELVAAAAECSCRGVRAIAVTTDVTSEHDCAELVARAEREIGPVDILVNNAGFAIFDPIESAATADLESMMKTNYFGALYCTRAVLPSMIARARGSIINVASIAGIMGYERMGGYCATKFALIGLSEALRDEVMSRGLRVSLVCPGTTETPFFEKAERGKMPGASRLILAVSPERVARAVRRAAENGSVRIIVPASAAAFMKLKEMFPRTAHFLMRNLSAVIERNRK
jgi:uncharacterized protein